MSVCTSCGEVFRPGEARVSWFTPDEVGNTVDRGAIHLDHLTRRHVEPRTARVVVEIPSCG